MKKFVQSILCLALVVSMAGCEANKTEVIEEKGSEIVSEMIEEVDLNAITGEAQETEATTEVTEVTETEFEAEVSDDVTLEAIAQSYDSFNKMVESGVFGEEVKPVTTDDIVCIEYADFDNDGNNEAFFCKKATDGEYIVVYANTFEGVCETIDVDYNTSCKYSATTAVLGEDEVGKYVVLHGEPNEQGYAEAYICFWHEVHGALAETMHYNVETQQIVVERDGVYVPCERVNGNIRFETVGSLETSSLDVAGDVAQILNEVVYNDDYTQKRFFQYIGNVLTNYFYGDEFNDVKNKLIAMDFTIPVIATEVNGTKVSDTVFESVREKYWSIFEHNFTSEQIEKLFYVYNPIVGIYEIRDDGVKMVVFEYMNSVGEIYCNIYTPFAEKYNKDVFINVGVNIDNLIIYEDSEGYLFNNGEHYSRNTKTTGVREVDDDLTPHEVKVTRLV